MKILIIIFFICAILYGFFKKDARFDTVEKLCIYNTISSKLNDSEISLTVLNNYSKKCFNKSEYGELFKNIERSSNFIWKGHVYGVLITHKDTTIIKISRYGNFFKRLDNNEVYVFKSGYSKTKWEKILNEAIGNQL